MSYNKSILVGRLCADPELKTTQSGKNFCRFRIAVDRRFKDAEGKQNADFVDILGWGKTAEFVCDYFGKGKEILVDGEIRSGSYTDKDGNKRTSFEVVADRVSFVGPKDEPKRVEVEVDDLPFDDDGDEPF